jgi:hypothetical protein
MNSSLITIFALLSVALNAAAEPQAPKTSAPASISSNVSLIDDADAGWTWSGMVPYSNVGLAKSTGHAGGPGSYGVYTFDGTGIDIVVMRAPSVNVDGRSHKMGKLKISIDGHLKAEVSASSTDDDFNFSAYSVDGLPSKYHVVQLEPDAGWAVVDYIRVRNGSEGTGASPADPSNGLPSVLFSSKATPLSAINAVDYRSNVEGFDAGIGPELQIGNLPADWGLATIHAHSGDTAIRYSGSSNPGAAYCYMDAYRVNIPVSSNTWLNYWILPQQDNGRYVAVDLHCTDGSILSQSSAVDQNGRSTAPASGHGGGIPLYTWTPIRCHIGEWLSGKTIDKIWIAYARDNGAGQYRGYVDDLTIVDESDH